jgi:hypothetical protein
MPPSRFIQQAICYRARKALGKLRQAAAAGFRSFAAPTTSFCKSQLQPTRFSKSGKPRIALTDDRAKVTTSRNSSEWSALEKPVAPLPYRVLLPAGKFFPDFPHTGAGEGI